ncbi:MAG: adenylate/guanylate cyclase domain-containing protein [Solirubrobacterales bacterium]
MSETDESAEKEADKDLEVVDLDRSPGKWSRRLADAAKGFRRVLPGDPDFGDPISTGGENTSQVLGRKLAEAEGPTALREIGLGALQVWEAMATGGGFDNDGGTELTIVFTDLVGFSDWALETGDTAATRMLRESDTAISEALEEHEGRVVKRLGDGIMATFLEPTPAIEGLIAAHEAHREVKEADQPDLRAGAHHGFPRRVGRDYVGVDVNVAARVAEAAKAGQILASQTVCERLDDEKFRSRRKLLFRAKGAPSDLTVCAVERKDF